MHPKAIYSKYHTHFWAWTDSFGTMSPCPCFPLSKHYFYKKTSHNIPELQIFIWDLDLDLGCTPWFLGCTYVAAASFIRDFFFL